MDCLMLHRAPENEKTRGVRITSERRRIELLHGMGLGCIGGFCGCLRSGKHPPEESGGSMGPFWRRRQSVTEQLSRCPPVDP